MASKKSVIAVAALFLAIGAGGAGWWWTKQRPIKMVKERVLSVLVDPESAKFGEVNFNPKTRAGCGVVNARNRMGGYTGFTTFVAFDDGDVRFEPGVVDKGVSPERRMESLQEQINFLELAKANCLPDS